MEKIKQVWQVVEHYNKLEKFHGEVCQALEVLDDEGMNNTEIFSQLCTLKAQASEELKDFEKQYVTFQ